MALVLYMKVSEQDGLRDQHEDPPEYSEKMGIETAMTVFKEALVNTYLMSPPRIYRWEQMIFNPDYEGENFMDLTGIRETSERMQWETA